MKLKNLLLIKPPNYEKIKILFFVVLLSCLSISCDIDDSDDEDERFFLEKHGGTNWVLDDGNGFISYLRINNDTNNLLEDWYTYPSAINGCYEHTNYEEAIRIDEDEDYLVLNIPSESLTIRFSIEDDNLKVVVDNDISYWNESTKDVDEFEICN